MKGYNLPIRNRIWTTIKEYNYTHYKAMSMNLLKNKIPDVKPEKLAEILKSMIFDHELISPYEDHYSAITERGRPLNK